MLNYIDPFVQGIKTWPRISILKLFLRSWWRTSCCPEAAINSEEDPLAAR